MSIKNTGGPAFPRPLSQHDTKLPGQPVPGQDGMTLRDWFAGQALDGVMATMPGECTQRPGTNGYRERNLELATWAYDIADAMIEARTK